MELSEKVDAILTEITEIKIFMAEQTIYSKDKEKRLTTIEKYIEDDNNQKMKLAGALMVVSALWFILLDSVKQFWHKVF